MRQRREQAPQLEQRHHEKGEDDEEGPQQRLPDPLAEKGKPTQPHAPVEALRECAVLHRFGGGRLGSRGGTHDLHRSRGQTGDKFNLVIEAGESEAHRLFRRLTTTPAAAPWPAYRRSLASAGSRQ